MTIPTWLGTAKPALLQWLRTHPWGGGALISLFLSVLSGVVVALQYDVAEPFYSTGTIALVVPFGAFWRGLHYYSSQFFFVLLLAHCAVVVWNNQTTMRRGAWIRLTATLPCGLLLLFTGYVLRSDTTGEAAGAIAEHICLSVPLIGEQLNTLFFDLSGSGLRKVYAQHVIGLMILGGIAAWPHLRRYTASWRNHLPLAFCTLALAICLPVPIEANRFGLLFIAGPWFFLGLQELLRYLPPLVAGVLMPLIPLGLFLWLPIAPRRRSLALLAIGLWLFVYLGCTLLCLLRL